MSRKLVETDNGFGGGTSIVRGVEWSFPPFATPAAANDSTSEACGAFLSTLGRAGFRAA